MAKHKYLYGGLIILGGIVVIMWMKQYLTDKGVISKTAPTSTDPLGIGTLTLQPMFATTIGAQTGTVGFGASLQ